MDLKPLIDKTVCELAAMNRQEKIRTKNQMKTKLKDLKSWPYGRLTLLQRASVSHLLDRITDAKADHFVKERSRIWNEKNERTKK